MIVRRKHRAKFCLPLVAYSIVLSACYHAECCEEPPADGADQTSRSTAEVALFNGKNLDGWEIIEENDFEKHGKVEARDKQIVMEKGRPATGVSYQGDFPRTNYEVRLEGKRTDGGDFFCGMTFPVDQQYCTLILGGWGGGVTGLSNIDSESAVENESTDYVDFEQNRWYQVRLRVTDKSILAWVDKKLIVDVDRKDRKFSIWWEQEPVRPFGFASWYTSAALRNINLKRLGANAPDKPLE